MVQVIVSDQNRFEVSLRLFKKKVQKEGLIKEARTRIGYEKPSEKKKRKIKENIARNKKKKNRN
ncbi:MAG: 30S ribosomal protein S21 [Rickettsiales bacterium]|nr:30S ribosomal protein S21 [Rickettsiales bacterium]